MSIYSITTIRHFQLPVPMSAVMGKEWERQSQRGFSTGDPGARDKPRCGVDSAMLSVYLPANFLFCFLSPEALGLSSLSLSVSL